MAQKRIGAFAVILCFSISLWVRSDPEFRIGYAVLTVDPGSPAPAGTALFTYADNQGVVISQAGVAASEPILSGRIFVDQDGAETGIALVNTSQQSASIALVLRDSSGNLAGTRTLTLGAGNHVAKFVSELFPDLPAGFCGTLTFDVNEGIAAITLRLIKNSRNEDLYTTLPVVDLLQPASNESVVFPQVAAGGGWRTAILLINNSAQEQRGRVSLYGDEGARLLLRLGETETGEFPYTVPPNGACRLDLDGPANTLAGYAVVTPDPGNISPAGTAIFRITDNDGVVTEAGVAASVPTTSARIFVDHVGAYTGVALANRQVVAMDLVFSLLTTEGALIATAAVTVPPLGHVAKFAHEIFPDDVKEGFTGLIEINSTQPFCPVTLRQTRNSRNSPILTTLPVADLAHPPTAARLIFPQIAIGGGFSTRLILINTDNRALASGSFSFFQSNGSPWMVTIGREIADRFTYALAPRGGEQQIPASDAPIQNIAVLDPSTNIPTREIAVNEGNSLRPELLVTDATGARRDDFALSFISLDRAVATVESDGTITGRKAGCSTLTISSGGVVATATITVATVSIGIGAGKVTGIALDSARRLYLAATQDNTILLAQDIKELPAIYAGRKATPGLKNDVRLESLFRNPSFLSLHNAQGVLYVSDGANQVIRKVQPGPEGKVETLAGTGTRGSKDGRAGESEFNNPQGACLDGRGNLWIVDSGNHTIRRINLVTGMVETVAGKAGSAGFSDGVGGAARFDSPVGIASETETTNPSFLATAPVPVSMIVADTGNGALRRVKETGEVETIVAGGPRSAPGKMPAMMKGLAAASTFSSPTGVAVDPVGNIYVAETGASRARVMLRNGDIVPAVQAGTLSSPAGLAINQSGRIVIADGSRSAVEVVYGAPQIAGITPDRVDGRGGQTVTVRGANFSPDTIVALRGVLVTGLNVANTQELTFTVPVVASGLNSLTVLNRGGLAQKAILVTPTPLAELPRGYITTVAGGGNSSGDGGIATEARVVFPRGVAADSAGNVYFAEDGRVRRVDARTGIINTIAGTGEPGDSGDGGLAVAARISAPRGLALDAGGNVYVSDSDSNRVRRIDIGTGIISAVAGTGASSPPAGGIGDNGPAIEAQLINPTGIAIDSAGNLLIADEGHRRIRKVNATTQIITTVAGTGAAAVQSGGIGDNGPATEAQLMGPWDVALDVGANMYVADGDRVRRIDARTGIITTVAGGGTTHTFTFLQGGRSLPATSILLSPSAIAVDVAGDLYVAERLGNTICRVDVKTGLIARFAGLGILSQDHVPALEAALGEIWGITIDAAGNLLFGVIDNRVRQVDDRTHTVTTVAGTGRLGHSGDNGPAIAAEIFTGSLSASNYAKLTFDRQSNLYISDPWNECVRRVDGVTGVITTVYTPVYYTDLSVSPAHGIALDPAGNLYLGIGSQVIRRDPAGNISRIAGRTTSNPDPRFCQLWDGSSALDADLGPDVPALAIDRFGDLLISDTMHHRIRKVRTSSNILTTVVGSDSCISGGYSGDGGQATRARLNWPWGIALDRDGNLYIADWQNQRIRKVDVTTGLINTVVDMAFAKNLAVDDSGNIFFLDIDWKKIVKVEAATGKRSDITRSMFQEGTPMETGDNVPASKALLSDPTDIVIDSEGNLWVADSGSGRVRVIRGPL